MLHCFQASLITIITNKHHVLCFKFLFSFCKCVCYLFLLMFNTCNYMLLGVLDLDDELF